MLWWLPVIYRIPIEASSEHEKKTSNVCCCFSLLKKTNLHNFATTCFKPLHIRFSENKQLNAFAHSPERWNWTTLSLNSYRFEACTPDHWGSSGHQRRSGLSVYKPLALHVLPAYNEHASKQRSNSSRVCRPYSTWLGNAFLVCDSISFFINIFWLYTLKPFHFVLILVPAIPSCKYSWRSLAYSLLYDRASEEEERVKETAPLFWSVSAWRFAGRRRAAGREQPFLVTRLHRHSLLRHMHERPGALQSTLSGCLKGTLGA